MPLTNPWLSEPTPAKRLDRERLEERLLNLLSSQNMCVLATTGPDGPLATPVRYYPRGVAVLFTAAPRSPRHASSGVAPPMTKADLLHNSLRASQKGNFTADP
ncbi:hypothetical protein LUPAC07_04180 [Micromonospora noduli]|nr:hypothetical protein LUPAC07_04180 [Micromonospora noduli]